MRNLYKTSWCARVDSRYSPFGILGDRSFILWTTKPQTRQISWVTTLNLFWATPSLLQAPQLMWSAAWTGTSVSQCHGALPQKLINIIPRSLLRQKNIQDGRSLFQVADSWGCLEGYFYVGNENSASTTPMAGPGWSKEKRWWGGNGEQHADIEILKIEVITSLSFTSEKKSIFGAWQTDCYVDCSKGARKVQLPCYVAYMETVQQEVNWV